MPIRAFVFPWTPCPVADPGHGALLRHISICMAWSHWVHSGGVVGLSDQFVAVIYIELWVMHTVEGEVELVALASQLMVFWETLFRLLATHRNEHCNISLIP